MRAATIALQLVLWSGLVVALLVTTSHRRAAAAARRAARRAARTHVGAEHMLGSVPGCPGCDTWRAKFASLSPARQHGKAHLLRQAARQRHPSAGPVVRLTNVERTRIDGRWYP